MEIVWLGHSCFRLRRGDVAAITDPFPDTLGISMGRPSAQIVTISHQHVNHSYWAGVDGNPMVIKGPGEYELQGVYVKGVLTPPAPDEPLDKRNTAYLIEMDGVTCLHPGDIGSPLSTGLVEELSTADVLFVPAGGVCTLKVSQLSQLIQAVEPKIIIPMHYHLPGLQSDLEPLDRFLREMGIRDPQVQQRITVTPTNLGTEARVVVLQPAPVS